MGRNAAECLLGVAESATGGSIGAAITSIPGSSDTFRGSIVAYDELIKASLLDVSAGRLS